MQILVFAHARHGLNVHGRKLEVVIHEKIHDGQGRNVEGWQRFPRDGKTFAFMEPLNPVFDYDAVVGEMRSHAMEAVLTMAPLMPSLTISRATA